MGMITYVINTDQSKKEITTFLKSSNFSSKIYTWKELFSDRNSKIKQKTKKLTEEMFSTEFDTPLNSSKKEIGLKNCTFIKTEDDILELLRDNYELIEII